MKEYSPWKTLALWVIVIAVFAVFFQPRRPVRAEAEEGSLAITGASGYTAVIRYEDVTGMELRDSLDYGTKLDGTDSRKEKSGTWENDEFGTYELCVSAKFPTCIVLTTEAGTTVVNFESERSTRSLYEALGEQIG